MIKYFFLLLLILGCSSQPLKKLEDKVVLFNEEEQKAYSLLTQNKPNAFKEIINSLNFNHVGESEETFLHGAISISDIELFKDIIKRHGIHKIDKMNIFSKSALTLSIENNDVTKAEILLKSGANVNQRGFLEEPIFFIPLKNKNLRMLNLLMSYNFDPNVKGFMEKLWGDFHFAEKEMLDYQNRYNKKYKKISKIQSYSYKQIPY